MRLTFLHKSVAGSHEVDEEHSMKDILPQVFTTEDCGIKQTISPECICGALEKEAMR